VSSRRHQYLSSYQVLTFNGTYAHQIGASRSRRIVRTPTFSSSEHGSQGAEIRWFRDLVVPVGAWVGNFNIQYGAVAGLLPAFDPTASSSPCPGGFASLTVDMCCRRGAPGFRYDAHICHTLRRGAGARRIGFLPPENRSAACEVPFTFGDGTAPMKRPPRARTMARSMETVHVFIEAGMLL